jgi:histidinol dehydrogenase
MAPEHLEIMTQNAETLSFEIENAGAIFLGLWSAEAVGDYFAGTNHVLPTGGSARFASSLGVSDFIKDISVINYSAARMKKAAKSIITLAETEGLTAHAEAARLRLEDLAGY